MVQKCPPSTRRAPRTERGWRRLPLCPGRIRRGRGRLAAGVTLLPAARLDRVSAAQNLLRLPQHFKPCQAWEGWGSPNTPIMARVQVFWVL